jgi:hypothetical protein
VIFWIIVLIHQVIALDSLLAWRLTASIFRFIGSLIT